MSANTQILITRFLNEKECRYIQTLPFSNILSTEKVNISNVTYFTESPEVNKFRIENIFQKVLTFGHRSFSEDSSSLISNLSFDNLNYWYYIRFSLFSQFYPQLVERELIKSMLASRPEPNRLIIFSNYIHPTTAEYLLPSEELLNKTNNLAVLSIFILRFFIGFFLHFNNLKRKHFIFLEPYNLQKVLNIRSSEIMDFIKGDYYNEYLTDKALTQNDFAFISDFYFPKKFTFSSINVANVLNKYTSKSLYFEYYFLKAFLNPFFLKRIFSFRRKIKKSLSTLVAKDNDDKLLLCGVKSMLNLVTLMYVRESVFKKLAISKKMKSVTCHHEQVYHHLSFMRGASQAGVKGIGFQHGIIHPRHMHYVYGMEDVKYNPFPDFMITWGNYWRNMLINESSYPPERVVSLGQIRTDIIPKLKNSRKNPDKIRLLYASQPHYRPEVRKRITEDLLHFSASETKVELIIKPHPGELDSSHYFSTIALNLGLPNPQLSFDDLYLSLSQCDILITHNSTVAAEAIYFKKPVFIYDFEDSDVSGFTKHVGAVFKADSISSLKKLFSDYMIENLNINENVQDEFINSFCYAIDGNTCSRYIDFIRKMA